MNAPVNAPVAAPRHFLGLLDLTTAELRRILDLSAAMKKARVKGAPPAQRPLAGKTLAMIFDRPSTRTRVSFDIGMRELGGETIMLTGAEMQLGRGETIADTARVLSRYVEAIVIRILSQDHMLEMAAHSTVPVINGLTRQSHPCQVLADILTFEERKGPIRGRKIAWSGDYNNVLSSWIDASARLDFMLDIACPRELQPTKQRLAAARAAGANIVLREDPVEAVENAEAVLSDCWVSMGDEDEGRRQNLLQPYQVNSALLGRAASDAIFMHCLPAHRGEEVTDEVIDGPQSAVWDEAENPRTRRRGCSPGAWERACERDRAGRVGQGHRRHRPAFRRRGFEHPRASRSSRPGGRSPPQAPRLSGVGVETSGGSRGARGAPRFDPEARGPLPAADEDGRSRLDGARRLRRPVELQGPGAVRQGASRAHRGRRGFARPRPYGFHHRSRRRHDPLSGRHRPRRPGLRACGAPLFRTIGADPDAGAARGRRDGRGPQPRLAGRGPHRPVSSGLDPATRRFSPGRRAGGDGAASGRGG